MFANELHKSRISAFWALFGGEQKRSGIGFEKSAKLAAMKELAEVVIEYRKQKTLPTRREEFNEARPTTFKFRPSAVCFGCGEKPTQRHHLILLSHGGINSKKNVVPICRDCHKEIHPWLD